MSRDRAFASGNYVSVMHEIEVPESWRTTQRWSRTVYNGRIVDNLPDAARVIDEVGIEAVPVFLRSLDWYFVDGYTREILLEVLAHLPVRTTFEGLLARAAKTDVPKAFEICAARVPETALAVLDGRLDAPMSAALRARLLAAHPHLAGPEEDPRPEWSGDDIPELLTSPPWNRPRAAPVTVDPPCLEPRIEWLDDHEREAWRFNRWSMRDPTYYDDYLVKYPDWALFFTSGSEDRVRPLLAGWEAEKFSFYMVQPRVLVAKYELDAYAPVLRLARAKPAVGADLLAPYVSDDVAQLMGRWLARSRQYRELARSWFDRHGPSAAIHLIPLAVGKPSTAAMTAALAVSRLDPDLVRRAGVLLDATEAVEDLLARDPLELIPSTVPKIPGWLDIDVLPEVLDPGQDNRLGANEREALVRMVAMSDLSEPYPGLALVAERLDQASLAEFGWALFCQWHISGAPSKDAWALNAVGFFGNATLAERLAPLVSRWPSDGMAQRAKRGAEVLAQMQTPAGLQKLSWIARAAKSTPLRKHAAGILSAAAADRGLLPEQLDDLLAADLDLDGDPIEVHGVTYRPTVSAGLELVLTDPDGNITASPPRPQDGEAKAAVAGWKKRQRTAKVVLADQSRRLEEAMVVQRRWHIGDFQTAIVGHPVLRVLASRIIWDLNGTLACLDPLGDLVDPSGGLVEEPVWLRIAHPANASLDRWRVWLDDRAIVQPFEQVHREVVDQDPSIYWNKVASGASFHALIRRGWRWGPTGHRAIRDTMIRPFGAEGNVVLTIDPGLSAVSDPAGEPRQTIASLTFQSAVHNDLGLFTDLPAVTRSELVRDLELLELAD
ncbi:MAG: hypothetical protein JWP74_65 [Marmoricola sp.]|nr:hypothetical protein [Marmoricola sp.]